MRERSPLRVLWALCVSALAFSFCTLPSAAQSQTAYLGFDRNQYPGDAAMKLLRKDFAFTGYWLGAPPGEKANSWSGKREYVRSLGYGFLLLINGRDSRELKTRDDATAKGTADAKAASDSARREHFSPGAIIFVDIEEGGRLTTNYHSYLRAWAEELRRDGFDPGVYCSAMPVEEGGDTIISSSADLHSDPFLPKLTYWVYNDACPPSSGCSVTSQPLAPSGSGAKYAEVWQFAQSPRRKQYTSRCAVKYAKDNNCYAPSDVAHQWFLDLNSATSPDPSGGAK